MSDKDLIESFTLCMPDGFIISLPIYKGESFDEKISSFMEHWYKVTNENPSKFNHFDIKDKCPKCGGPMRCKLNGNYAMVWCIDHKCRYTNIEEGDKASERMFERHGLKVKTTHKTGASAIFSNAPIKKNK